MFIATLDAGVIVEANPAACQMLGYRYEEMIGLSPDAIVHPDSLFQAAHDLQALQAGRSPSGNMVLQRKDGTTFPTEGRSTIFAFKGLPHLLAVLRDINDRVEAERQLREREEQYRGIFEATSDGLIIADVNGVIVEANPAACSIYGYAYEDLLGLSPTTLTHPDSLAQVTKDIQTIKSGGRVLTRPIGLRKDGSSFYAEVHGTPFTYKGQPHALAIVRDVTAQVEAVQQLREREEQYRSIFEAASDAMFIADLNGHIVEVNPAACQMYGYSHQEFIGLLTTTTFHPDYHHLIAESLRVIQSGGQVPNQLVALRKDGSTFPIEARGTAFTYMGKPHILGIARHHRTRAGRTAIAREGKAVSQHLREYL
jgi:PAS domain S-box-containing protein